MHAQSEIVVPFLSFLLYVGQRVAAVDDGYRIVEVLEPVEKQPLFCYRCYEFEDGCQSLANISAIESVLCNDYESFCKVRRIHVHKKLTSFERVCSRECTPGCNSILFRTQCVSCCTTSHCNTDSSGSKTAHAWTLVMASGLVALLWTSA